MGQTLSAVYEHGSLRLLEPVDLAELSEVRVQILAPEEDFQTMAFRRLIVSIQRLSDNAEEAWNEELVRATFLRLLRDDLHLLWQVSREPQRELCVLLQLAIARLQPAHLTRTQLTVIRTTLDLLTKLSLTEDEIRVCHDRLIAAGFPPAFAFDAETVQSYVDELQTACSRDLTNFDVAPGVSHQRLAPVDMTPNQLIRHEYSAIQTDDAAARRR
jgi:predicted DNA-binding antitoxin AbrB/MazE fold protein